MLKLHKNPPRERWQALCQRPGFDHSELVATVSAILENVKNRGQEALLDYSKRFDNASLETLRVSEEELATAEVSAALKSAIELSIKNIETFHSRQREEPEIVEPMPGVKLWRRSSAIDSVGLYIPGGSAPLFSTVLMLGIPARLAGCNNIILCSPPQADGTLPASILYAAKQVGVTDIFKLGGAQAVGAMAYGAGEVPKVHKLFGPGNQYVTAAKQLVAAEGVAIDMPAGPTEVLVLADESANPEFVAADLLSQAEHGADSQVVLVSLSKTLAENVEAELKKQIQDLPRKDTALKALENSCCIEFLAETEALEFVNIYAAEHLILAHKNAKELSEKISSAGSVFVGHFSPESAGDYASGTNHTLPTGGAAAAFSGVSLDSFFKKITFQQISPEGLKAIGPAVEEMAEREELVGHKRAVSIRTRNR